MKATAMWRSFSMSVMKRPSSASKLRISPMLGDDAHQLHALGESPCRRAP